MTRNAALFIALVASGCVATFPKATISKPEFAERATLIPGQSYYKIVWHFGGTGVDVPENPYVYCRLEFTPGTGGTQAKAVTLDAASGMGSETPIWDSYYAPDGKNIGGVMVYNGGDIQVTLRMLDLTSDQPLRESFDRARPAFERASRVMQFVGLPSVAATPVFDEIATTVQAIWAATPDKRIAGETIRLVNEGRLRAGSAEWRIDDELAVRMSIEVVEARNTPLEHIDVAQAWLEGTVSSVDPRDALALFPRNVQQVSERIRLKIMVGNGEIEDLITSYRLHVRSSLTLDDQVRVAKAAVAKLEAALGAAGPNAAVGAANMVKEFVRRMNELNGGDTVNPPEEPGDDEPHEFILGKTRFGEGVLR